MNVSHNSKTLPCQKLRQDFYVGKRFVDAGALLVVLLVVIPAQNLRAISQRFCACSPSARACLEHPWLHTFPCNHDNKLHQLTWLARHWATSGWALHVRGGDWEGCWVQLGAWFLLVVALASSNRWYGQYRSKLTVAWRLGMWVVGLAALILNHLFGGLPLAGAHMGRNTQWGTTRLVWHVLLNAVPSRTNLWLAPVELACAALCALLAHTAHLTPAFMAEVLLKQLLLGFLIPSGLLWYAEASQNPALRQPTPQPPTPSLPGAPTTGGHSAPGSVPTPVHISHSGPPCSSAKSPTTSPSQTLAPRNSAAPTQLPSGLNSAAPTQLPSGPRLTLTTSRPPCLKLAAPAQSLARSLAEGASSWKGQTPAAGSWATPAPESCRALQPITNSPPAAAPKPGAAAPPGPGAKGQLLYRSRTKTRMVSLKVPHPAAALEADPAPLVAAVQGALLRAAPPGAAVACRYAVFRGCIHLLVWVQQDAKAASAVGDDVLSTVVEGAVRVTAEGVLGRECELSVKVTDDDQKRQLSEGCWWVEGGWVSLHKGMEELVVRMVVGGGEGHGLGDLAATGGRARVMLVEGGGGQVLVDEEVVVEGSWRQWSEGQEVVLAEACRSGAVSLRVPIPSDIHPASPPTHPSMAHLLVLPVGDTKGAVLWSTPLLLGAPQQVGAELAQLHADTADSLLEALPSQTATTGTAPATAAAQAQASATSYQQHLVPLVWDLFTCLVPGCMPNPGCEDALQHIMGYLDGPNKPLPTTRSWLQHAMRQDAEPDSPTTAATNPPRPTTPTLHPSQPPPPSPSPSTSSTAPIALPHPRRATLVATLRGGFPSPLQEAAYEAYLKAHTLLLDRTLLVLQPLLLLAMFFNLHVRTSLVHTGAAALNLLQAAVLLLLRLRLHGTARQAAGRQRLVSVLVSLSVLSLVPFSAGVVHFPEECVELFRRDFTKFGILFGAFFNFAAFQAGFVRTTATAAVYAAQLVWIMAPLFESLQDLLARMVAHTAAVACLTFLAEYHSRRSFLLVSMAKTTF